MLAHQLVEHVAQRLVDLHLGVLVEEAGEVAGQRGVGGHGHAGGGGAVVEAAAAVDQVGLGQAAEVARQRGVPDGVD